MSEDSGVTPPTKSKVNFSFDLRAIIALLLAVIIIMLVLWKPWQANSAATDRTIDVTGEATITAEPDEFVFYPNYQFKNDSKEVALGEATTKSNMIVAKLKELGVADNKIKVDTSGFETIYMPRETAEVPTYTMQLTVTVSSKEEAQKVQDYLVTTTPSGSVSPQGSFSDAKRKELEDQARDKATKDARDKADKSARNLGFKVGKVKTVTDGAGFSGITPMSARGVAVDTLEAKSSSLPVQPGENELSYSVQVTYYLR
jgi:uncharacterized protein YggE